MRHALECLKETLRAQNKITSTVFIWQTKPQATKNRKILMVFKYSRYSDETRTFVLGNRTIVAIDNNRTRFLKSEPKGLHYIDTTFWDDRF